MNIEVFNNDYEYSRLLIASLVFALSFIPIWINKHFNDKRSKKEKLTEKIELISLTALELQDSMDQIYHVKRTDTPYDYLEFRNKSMQLTFKLENLISLYFKKDLGNFEFKALQELIQQSYSSSLEVHNFLQKENKTLTELIEFRTPFEHLSIDFSKTLKELQVSIIKVSNLYTYSHD
jgi:hypothetical protein